MALLPFDQKGLTAEVQKKAELELGETPDVRAAAVDELRRLICKEPDIHSRLSDIFLLRFLRCKKYDVQIALKVLRNYWTFMTKHKGGYTCRTPSELKHVLDMRYALVVPHRVHPGHPLLIFRVANFDLQRASPKELIAMHLMAGEISLEYEMSQVCGGIYILDLKDVTFAHFTQLITISLVSFAFDALQDKWPERFKGLHFVNEPLLLHGVFKFCSIFLKKKLKERVHFHGSDLDSLYKYVPKEYLTKELGGNAGPFGDEEYVDFFLSKEAYYQKIKTHGIVNVTSQ